MIFIMHIQTLTDSKSAISPPASFCEFAHCSDESLHLEAQANRLSFWETQAKQLHWHRPWDKTLVWERPISKWFVGGQLNAAYNCLDVHQGTERWEKTAIIWEGEEGETLSLTYQELHAKVCQVANALQHRFKVQRGDRVTIYMPMVIDLAVAVLACARIGAIHSVVFGGFSAQSLRDRILDSGSKLLITANAGRRRGQVLALKDIVDEALSDSTPITDVMVCDAVAGYDCPMQAGRDHRWDAVIANQPRTQEAEVMKSEDPLFILYTSGTTGKPKGIVHSTGGYMTHAKYSTKYVFDLKDDDVYWCTADVGWITGHTYLIYGPMANGATVVMFEGTPDYPTKDRFWELIAKQKVSIFYTAPTAIRAFMKWGVEHVTKHDLSSLRLLGTVGEPINPEAWEWYHKIIGGRRCPIVDTWWQTETGGIMITTLPGAQTIKPGCAGTPLPGISAEILTPSGKSVTQGGGLLSLTEPWPSMLRGIWGDMERFKDVYWSTFETYFAGDGATRDADGYFMVLGRVDDVLNVAGHRIGTMEVESCLVDHKSVAEAAVVGIADDIKGQAIVAYVIVHEGIMVSDALESELIQFVSQKIGAIAKPKRVVLTPDSPKTRSGKIMRRVLKALANGEPIGDVTTLANPDIVQHLQDNA